jgi:alpha-tubulin suppressor-like RCC1 family protein
VKHSGLLRAAPLRRFALLAATLLFAIVSCKKDTTSPILGSKLAFTVQPTNTTVDSSIVPAVVVTVEDASGNPVTAATTQVSLSINGTDSDADLIGTPTVDASSGVATFPYLSVNRPGTGYTLTASATGLTSATSAAFNVGLITMGPFTQVNIGANSACAVTTGGTGYCWGNNTNGQLGNGATTNTTTPVRIAGGLTFGTVGAGSLQYFSCGLVTSGAAYCWGYNDYGQLGNGTFVASANPVAVTGNLTFGALSVGEGGHACGIAGGGAAYCWGYNASGQLGVSSVAYTNSPVAVSGGLAFAAISAGENAQTCGVTAAGAGYCWGFNGDGELGNGTTTNTNAPTAVSGGLVFSNISAGYVSTCGLTTAGAAYCWGDNTYGELGNGTTTNSSTPVAVGGNHTYSSLSVGDAFACGVATGGTVYCWGYGSQGQLGTGAIAASSAPIAIFGGLTYSSVSAGYASACAVTTGGAAYCWGNNSFGQLGNRSITATLVPALVVTPP